MPYISDAAIKCRELARLADGKGLLLDRPEKREPSARALFLAFEDHCKDAGVEAPTCKTLQDNLGKETFAETTSRALLAFCGLSPDFPAWYAPLDGDSAEAKARAFRTALSPQRTEPFPFVLEPSKAEALVDEAFAIAMLGYRQDGEGAVLCDASFGPVDCDGVDFALRRCHLTVTLPPGVTAVAKSWVGADGPHQEGALRIVARCVSGALNWQVLPGERADPPVLSGYLGFADAPLFVFNEGLDGAEVELVIRASPKAASRPYDPRDAEDPEFDAARQRIIERLQQLKTFGSGDDVVLSRHVRTLKRTPEPGSETDDG